MKLNNDGLKGRANDGLKSRGKEPADFSHLSTKHSETEPWRTPARPGSSFPRGALNSHPDDLSSMTQDEIDSRREDIHRDIARIYYDGVKKSRKATFPA